MMEEITEGGNGEGGALCLGEMLFVVAGKIFVHGFDVVDAGPLGVGVLWIAVVKGDFEIVHVAIRWWIDIAGETLKHGTFSFGLNNALYDNCDIMVAVCGGIELTLS